MQKRCNTLFSCLDKSLENVLEIDVWKKKLPADGDDTSIDVIYVMH